MVHAFTWLIASVLLQQSDTTAPPPPPRRPASFEAFNPAPDSGRPRPKAIEFSDAYYTRLTIHRYASYTMLPLFAAEYALGQSLYNQNVDSVRLGSTRSWHAFVAQSIGVLFAVNTVTGVWNMWEGRKATEGRTRRYVHAGLMLLSDAGFVYTASLAPGRRNFETGKATHKEAAMISFSTAVVGDLMMLLWNKK